MTPRTLVRHAIVAAFAVAVTACGSTVATTSAVPGSEQTRDGGRSLGGGAAPGPSTSGVPVPGGTSGGGAVGTSGTTGTVGGTSPTGGSSGTVGGTSTGGTRRPGAGRPVEVGVTVLVSSQDGAARLGFGEFATGDAREQVKAIVKYVNAHGGLAGSPIIPVIFEVDGTTTQPYDTLYQSICDYWTQDHKVIAGIYFRPMSSMVLPSCMQKRRTPLIAVGQGNIGSDAFQRYPLLSTPIWPSMDRAYRSLVERSAAQGYFKPGAKIGLLRFDTPAMKRVADQQIKPALARLGAKVHDEVAFSMPESTADLSGITSQMSGAVLRFQANGINEVIVEDFAALIGILFPQAAQGGGYKPAHGYALTSDSLPAYTAAGAPDGQLDGAVGMGWSPSQSGVDVEYAQNPVRDTVAARNCLAAMKAGGQDMRASSTRQNAFVYCDLFLALKAAVDAGGVAHPLAYQQGLNRLASGFSSALTFRTSFAPARHDGPAALRDLYFDSACECFRYRGGNRPL